MYNPITENDLIQKKYLDVIEGKECRLFPSYNLKQILFNETYYAIHEKVHIGFLYILKRLIVNPCAIAKDIKGRALLTLYTKNYRIDHDSYWDKICEDAGDHDDIKLLSHKKDRLKQIAPWLIFKKYRWYRTALEDLSYIDNINHRKFLAVRLVMRKWTLEEIKKLKLHPKIVMCFFDSSPDENVLMQYFKKQGAITITNQHGQSVFVSHDYERLSQSQLLNFKCDYYFAKGQKQKEQLIAAGTVGADRVKLIGIVGDEGEKSYCRRIQNETVIGVYLDCPTFDFADRTNREMIKLLQTVAKSKGYKYFLKPHPSENNFNFPLDENCLGVFGKEEKLRDTFNKATIAVISVSGTYLDAYTHGLRCLKYSSDVKFPIAVEEDCFSNAVELEEMIEAWIHEENKDTHLKRVNGIYNAGWRPGLVKETIKGIAGGK